MKKFYQSTSGRSTPESGESKPDSNRRIQDFQQERLSEVWLIYFDVKVYSNSWNFKQLESVKNYWLQRKNHMFFS